MALPPIEIIYARVHRDLVAVQRADFCAADREQCKLKSDQIQAARIRPSAATTMASGYASFFGNGAMVTDVPHRSQR
jgi:hypothetical protein